ncbi:MAG: acylneuraminate cytidylyltransferase family protein [Lachnospiraceae bacterium]|nr:acylneuraminate cytidylyltransferase family protein [Lachnospiraceae bacterium]
MKITAFVPIKLNSERLPGKNIKPFTNGKPLIYYILKTLKKVIGLDDIYVYCSDESIQLYLPKGIKFLKRPSYLDLSTTSFNEVLVSFAKEVPSDYYLLAHATAPFILPETFQKAITAIRSDLYDSVFTVKKLQEFLWKDNRPINYHPSFIPRTQDLPAYFAETCGMYLYPKNLILSKHRRIGDAPYLLEISPIEAFDINTPEDFTIADSIFNSYVKGNHYHE